LARIQLTRVDHRVAVLARVLSRTHAPIIADAGRDREANAAVQAWLIGALVDRGLALGVGPAARTRAPVAVDQVNAGAAVHARVALTLVDLYLAISARVARVAGAQIVVYGLAAYALPANAQRGLAKVDQGLTVGAAVAGRAKTRGV
jgi:hypothetical protein